jgi:hypothetical protein
MEINIGRGWRRKVEWFERLKGRSKGRLNAGRKSG